MTCVIPGERLTGTSQKKRREMTPLRPVPRAWMAGGNGGGTFRTKCGGGKGFLRLKSVMEMEVQKFRKTLRVKELKVKG